MNELELFDTLGIILDPDYNRLAITEDIQISIENLSYVLCEMNTQKKSYGTLNPDIWLEFIPWHSLN